ncbi:hypothetical protein ALC62_00374, partial [Cyphomyrmex costatus]
LIISFNQQCEKYKLSEHNDGMIRQKLRRIGRLFQEIKNKQPEITDFVSIFFPRYSRCCIEAINTLTGLSLCGFYKIPELLAEDFLKVFSEDFTTHITKTIAETMNQNKRYKKVVLPSKSNIIQLHNFLQENRQAAYNVLKEKFSYEAWLTLTKATLTSVQVFNRRRAGEIQRSLIEDYKTYEGIHYQTNEMYEALSSQNKAKQIAKKYVRFILRGKLGRTVLVLLTAVNILLDKIHMSHYRQSVMEKEILEISRYLEAAQGVDDDNDPNSENENDNDLNCNKNEVTTLREKHNKDEIYNEVTSNDVIQDLQQKGICLNKNIKILYITLLHRVLLILYSYEFFP